MEEFERSLLSFYERQAARLLKLARDCTDKNTQDQLIAMASEYIGKLDRVPGEKKIERAKRTSH